jgi:hypothetical protein
MTDYEDRLEPFTSAEACTVSVDCDVALIRNPGFAGATIIGDESEIDSDM